MVSSDWCYHTKLVLILGLQQELSRYGNYGGGAIITWANSLLWVEHMMPHCLHAMWPVTIIAVFLTLVVLFLTGWAVCPGKVSVWCHVPEESLCGVMSWRSLRVCHHVLWFPLCPGGASVRASLLCVLVEPPCVCWVTGRCLPVSSTECSVGTSILHRKGCDSTRALPRCLL